MPTRPRATRPHARRARILAPAVAALFVIACGRDDRTAASGDVGAESETAPVAAGAAPAAGGTEGELTEADLDLYERGLRAEIELVRAAQERARAATTPAARGEATQAQWADRTAPDAARALGVDVDRYRRVRASVHPILETLDFQGAIEGPLEIDVARAAPAMRARLAGDPLAALPPASATAFRGRLARLAPVFAEYVTLTAVAG